MSTGWPTWSSSSNNLGSVDFEQVETSIPIDEFEQKLRKNIYPSYKRRKNQVLLNVGIVDK